MPPFRGGILGWGGSAAKPSAKLVDSDSFGVEPVPDGGIQRTAFSPGPGAVLGHRTWRRVRRHARQPFGIALARPDPAQGRRALPIRAGCLALVDLGSRNGSFVNGTRVSFPVALNDKDKILFGDQQLIFCNPARSASLLTAPGVDPRNEPTTALHTNRLTTILVVDIRDFTPLARSLPESLLSQTIGTWFLRSGQIARRQGSWAQKYIGDAVMAVWVHDRPPHAGADILRVLRAVSEIDTAAASPM